MIQQSTSKAKPNHSFRKDDVVKCTNNNTTNLTKGASYVVLNYNDRCIWVKDDSGITDIFSASRFELVRKGHSLEAYKGLVDELVLYTGKLNLSATIQDRDALMKNGEYVKQLIFNLANALDKMDKL